MDESRIRACRILILGDGNFSFSLALARALPPGFEMVATSFDGPVDLLGKYPESPGIVVALRSLGVTVLHNVDATALDARVVEPGTPSEMDGCGCPKQRRQYEHVIFNHPHTGTEDMRRHRSFLGHFFHAVAHSTTKAETAAECNTSVDTGVVGASRGGDGATASGVAGTHCGTDSVLAPGGAIHVTLALDQPERWGLQKQAARHGFSLAHRRRFPAERIDGYMTKRHQTGRSFQQRVQNSETLSFVWASRAMADEGEPATAGVGDRCTRSYGGSCDQNTCAAGENGVATLSVRGLGSVEDGMEEQKKDMISGGGGGRADVVVAQGGTGAPASSASTLPPWLRPDVNMCGKPGLDAEGHGIAGGGAVAGTPGTDDGRCTDVKGDNRKRGECHGKAAAAVLLTEVCELCDKRYKTPQALRTHIRQFHELGQEGGVPLVLKKEEPCPHCGRTFTSSRALDQHVLAKHSGNNVDIKPDWFVGSIYHLEPPPPASNRDSSTAIATISSNQSQLGVAVNPESRSPHAPSETVAAPEIVVLASAAPRQTNSHSGGVHQECDVCGYWFYSSADAQQHLDNLRPPIEGAVTRYDCRTCAKDFGSRRALLQHTNFCGGGSGAEVVVEGECR